MVRDDAGHSVRVTMKDFESEGSKKPPEKGKAEAWELVATSVAVSSS